MSVKKILGIAALLVAGAGLLWAAHRTVGDGDARAEWFSENEYQIRRILGLPPELGLEFKARAPSDFDGYDKVTLNLIRPEGPKAFDLFITRDGSSLIYDRVYPLAHPFSAIVETINLEHAPYLGEKDAPVTIVKYSDYTCGYCRRFYFSMQEKFLERYKGRVRFYHKLFPAIGYREHAQNSAVAGACALRQGNEQFWAMHHELFQNVEKFGEGSPAFLAMAQRAKLDIPVFQKCFDQKDSLVDISRDYQEGSLLKVDGTPTFFINGRPISGVPSEEHFYRLIDEELELAAKR
jgi:protein-disulfide isomerase